MHIIRVFKWTGGLAATFSGIDAEKKMMEAFNGEPDHNIYHVLR